MEITITDFKLENSPVFNPTQLKVEFLKTSSFRSYRNTSAVFQYS